MPCRYGINMRKPEYFADRLSAGVEVALQQARDRERERVDRIREKGKAVVRKEKFDKEKEDKSEG